MESRFEVAGEEGADVCSPLTSLVGICCGIGLEDDGAPEELGFAAMCVVAIGGGIWIRTWMGDIVNVRLENKRCKRFVGQSASQTRIFCGNLDI